LLLLIKGKFTKVVVWYHLRLLLYSWDISSCLLRVEYVVLGVSTSGWFLVYLKLSKIGCLLEVPNVVISLFLVQILVVHIFFILITVIVLTLQYYSLVVNYVTLTFDFVFKRCVGYLFLFYLYIFSQTLDTTLFTITRFHAGYTSREHTHTYMCTTPKLTSTHCDVLRPNARTV
jgi:hypothetical protein